MKNKAIFVKFNAFIGVSLKNKRYTLLVNMHKIFKYFPTFAKKILKKVWFIKNDCGTTLFVYFGIRSMITQTVALINVVKTFEELKF